MIRAAILGAGTMGRLHGEQLVALPDVRVASVFDADPRAARALAEALGARAAGSAEEALEGADAVWVCTPTPTHEEYVLEAAARGVAVFCEKPPALTLEAARRMRRACARARVPYMVGMVLRWFHEYRKIREVIVSGRLGEPGMIRTRRVGPLPLGPGSWYADEAASGGVILDLLIHDFDFVQWVCGPVKRVFASRRRLPGGGEYALVLARLSSGAIAHFEGSWAHPGGFRFGLEAAGPGGLLWFNSEEERPLLLEGAGAAEAAPGVAVPESPVAKSPYLLEDEAFLAALLGGDPPPLDELAAERALAVALAARESAASGRPVEPEEVAV